MKERRGNNMYMVVCLWSISVRLSECSWWMMLILSVRLYLNCNQAQPCVFVTLSERCWLNVNLVARRGWGKQSIDNSEKFNQNTFPSKITGRLQPQSCASACAFDGCYSSDAALKVHPQWDKLHWIINGLWWLTSVQARHASCASSLVHTEGAKELPVTHTGGALSA